MGALNCQRTWRSVSLNSSLILMCWLVPKKRWGNCEKELMFRSASSSQPGGKLEFPESADVECGVGEACEGEDLTEDEDEDDDEDGDCDDDSWLDRRGSEGCQA